jgi:cell division septation protein DedD
MSVEERRAPRSSGPGWLATAGGALLLVALGFGVGIVAGTAYQEPDLVADHLAGRTTEVALEPPQPLAAAPDVSAPAPESLDRPAAALGQGALEEAPEAELAPAEPALARGPAAVPAAAPKAPARPGPQLAAKSAAAGSFSIQVGAFSSEKAARQLAGALGKQGYTAYLMDEGDGARWKVRVGPVGSRSEAEAISARLKREQRLPTWIQTNGKS